LQGEGHTAAGWGHGWICYSCRLRGPKSVHSGNGLPLLALRHLVSIPVTTPLRIVNCCWSGFPCNWRYINVSEMTCYMCPVRRKTLLMPGFHHSVAVLPFRSYRCRCGSERKCWKRLSVYIGMKWPERWLVVGLRQNGKK